MLHTSLTLILITFSATNNKTLFFDKKLWFLNLYLVMLGTGFSETCWFKFSVGSFSKKFKSQISSKFILMSTSVVKDSVVFHVMRRHMLRIWPYS